MRKLIYKILGVKVISDTFTPKAGRSEKQIYYDAVLRMQNELVSHGAIRVEHLEDGKVIATIKTIK